MAYLGYVTIDGSGGNGSQAVTVPAGATFATVQTSMYDGTESTGHVQVSGCDLDKLVVGRDGVCVAVINPPNKPRAAFHVIVRRRLHHIQPSRRAESEDHGGRVAGGSRDGDSRFRVH